MSESIPFGCGLFWKTERGLVNIYKLRYFDKPRVLVVRPKKT
jgi:hypothetical protein